MDQKPAQASVKSAMADAARLDPAALARLAELDPSGQGGLLMRVLQTYADSMRRLLDELRDARVAGRTDVLGRVAHTLKSSSASVGASGFVALCARVEASIREADGSDLSPLLDELQDESLRVERAVRALLSS